MFVRVAPLFRLPAAKSVFDYEWQSAMMPLIGSCITIPFRGKTAAAIIIDVLEKSDFKTRPITVTTELKLLTPYETLWLEHMAQRFQEPVGMMCERMLPPLLVRTKNSFVRTAAPQTKSRPSLQYAWYKNKDTFFSTLDSITQKNKTPQLVVAHSHAAATEIFKYLTEQKLPVFYFDPTSNPLRRAAWNALVGVQNIKNCIIVGTQSLLWMPHSNARWIFVEPTHAAHENWNGAAYANRTILESRAKEFGEAIIFLAHSPDTAELTRDLHIPTMSLWPTVVDRTAEDPKNRQAPISPYVEEQIQKNKRVLLLTQHLKEASHIICKDCGRLAPFASLEKSMICETCGNSNFFSIGLGGMHLKNAITKIDTTAREIYLVDAKNAEQFSTTVDLEKSCIVIATSATFDTIPLASFDTIIDLATDTEFKFPTYNTEERVWKFLRAIASRLPQNWAGTWLVETRHPERAAWQVRDAEGFTRWWNEEKPLRERFGQPPFGSVEQRQQIV